MVVSTRSSTESGELRESQPSGYADSQDSSIKAGVDGCGIVAPEETSNVTISKFEDNFGDALEIFGQKERSQILAWSFQWL